jgi:uncharacterized protein (UPF0332 family)
MSHDTLITKANRAIQSARILFGDGDMDGACNRAYYAMIDAAKAALLIATSDVDSTIGKTHAGLIAAFGIKLVKTGVVPIEFGRLFNRAHDIRQAADYTGDIIEDEQIKEIITQASEFVEWIDHNLISGAKN